MYGARDVIFKIPEITQITTQGKGSKGLIIISSEDQLTDENLFFLNKIIEAIKYDLSEDCLLVKCPSEPLLIHEAIHREWKDAIIFGIKATHIGLQINHIGYEIIHLGDRRFIFCDKLDEIREKQTLKTALWNKLQLMFLSNK